MKKPDVVINFNIFTSVEQYEKIVGRVMGTYTDENEVPAPAPAPAPVKKPPLRTPTNPKQNYNVRLNYWKNDRTKSTTFTLPVYPFDKAGLTETDDKPCVVDVILENNGLLFTRHDGNTYHPAKGRRGSQNKTVVVQRKGRDKFVVVTCPVIYKDIFIHLLNHRAERKRGAKPGTVFHEINAMCAVDDQAVQFTWE